MSDLYSDGRGGADISALSSSNPPVGKSFLGVTLKPGVTRLAFVNYLVAYFLCIEILVVVASCGYFLLTDIYNVGIMDANDVLTDLTFWAEIWAIPMVPITGFLHDFFGRRIMFISGAAICTIMLAVYPLCKEVYPWLLVVRLILEQGIIQLLTNPLAGDYVINEKKGLASAYAGISSGLGAIIAAVALFKLGKDDDWGAPFYFSAAMSAVGCIYMALTLQNKHKDAPEGRCPILPDPSQGGVQRSSDLHIPSQDTYLKIKDEPA